MRKCCCCLVDFLVSCYKVGKIIFFNPFVFLIKENIFFHICFGIWIFHKFIRSAGCCLLYFYCFHLVISCCCCIFYFSQKTIQIQCVIKSKLQSIESIYLLYSFFLVLIQNYYFLFCFFLFIKLEILELCITYKS